MLFLFGKVFLAFLEPPGLFVTLLSLFFVVIRRKERYIFLALAIVIYFVSSGIGARLTHLPLPTPPPSHLPPQAIVIFGGGTDFDPARQAFTLSSLSMSRVLEGYRLFQEHPLPIFLSGGKVWPHEATSEASLMRELLATLGIPHECTILEERARNTWENARFTASLLKERNITAFYLVSSAFHLPRALFALSHFYPQAVVVPVAAPPFSYRRALRSTDFLPSPQAFLAFSWNVHEWGGLLFLRLRK